LPTAGGTGDGHSLDAVDDDPEDAVFVDAAGNVGIGTATPEEKLDVAGNVRAAGTIETTSGGFRFPDGTMQTTAATGATGTTGDGHSLDAADGNPTDVVFVTNDGQVGIGTATPGQKLSVDGVVESITGGFMFPDGTTQTTAAAGDGHSLDAADGNPTDVVFVTNTGLVGIGTKTPNWKLDVVGSANQFIAIQGISDTGIGVVGRSTGDAGSGVSGFSDSGIGVNGSSTSGPGVVGISSSGSGVAGLSDSSFGGTFTGPDNDGTIAALKISSRSPTGISQSMLLDGNEIDATVGDLFLNNNTNGDVVLANGGGNVRIGPGPDNDGSNAALEITSIGPGGTEQTMLLDGNEIDATVGTLFLNFNSSGDVSVVRGGGNFVVNTTVVHGSDRRLKKNITTLDGALDKVLNLRGVSFEWKKVEGRMSHPPKGIQIGVVAQEVEAVVPELVKTDAEGYKSVAYANITALLIEAVKAQQTTIDVQQAQMEALRSRVDTLESLMSQAAMLNKCNHLGRQHFG